MQKDFCRHASCTLNRVRILGLISGNTGVLAVAHVWYIGLLFASGPLAPEAARRPMAKDGRSLTELGY